MDNEETADAKDHTTQRRYNQREALEPAKETKRAVSEVMERLDEDLEAVDVHLPTGSTTVVATSICAITLDYLV